MDSFKRTEHRAKHWGNPEERGGWEEEKYAFIHARTCVCVYMKVSVTISI